MDTNDGFVAWMKSGWGDALAQWSALLQGDFIDGFGFGQGPGQGGGTTVSQLNGSPGSGGIGSGYGSSLGAVGTGSSIDWDSVEEDVVWGVIAIIILMVLLLLVLGKVEAL